MMIAQTNWTKQTGRAC